MPEGPKRRRLLRWLLWGLVTVAALAVTTVVGLELALKTRPVREILVNRIAPWVEEEYDVGVEVEDFSLSLLGGSLEIRDLALQADDGDPFARIEVVRAEWRPLSLLSGKLKVHELAIERPVVDLGKPLPELPESEISEPGAEPEIAIERVCVTDAVVEGTVPEALREELQSWRVSGGDVTGSIDGARFELSTATADVGINLVRAGPLDLEVVAEGGGALGGDIEIRRAVVKSTLLDVEVSGRVGNDVRDIDASFEVAVDPGFWLGLAPAGRATVVGAVELGAWTGAAEIRADGLLGELLREFVPDDLFRQLELGATTLGLESKLELVDANGVAGETRLVAKRDEEVVLRVDSRPRLQVPEPMFETFPFELDVNAQLLPTLPGAREVAASIQGDELRRPDEWRVGRGEMSIDSPDLDGLVATVARLWPQMVDRSVVAELPPLGLLAGEGQFSGPVNNPVLESRFEWRPHEDGVVSLTAVGHPLGTDLTVESEATDLSLAHFLEGASGRLEWAGNLGGGFASPQGGLHTAVWDLASSGEIVFDAVDVRVDGSADNLEWNFDAMSPMLGRIEGTGSLVPEPTLSRGEGSLALTPTDTSILGPFERIESTFQFAEGVAALQANGFRLEQQALTIDARLPLDAIARIPGAETLAAMPLERSDGLLDITWAVPPNDWVDLIPEEWRGRVGRFEGGTSGRIEFDTSCPACSRAHGEIAGLTAEVDGRPVTSAESLDLALGGGVLRLGPWKVSGEDLSLSIDGTAQLDESWDLGSEAAEFVADFRVRLDGQVGSSWLESLPLDVVTPGETSLHAEVAGSAAAWAGELTLTADDLVVAATALPGLPLSAPRAEITVADGEITVDRFTCDVGEGSLTAGGRLMLDEPLGDGRGFVRLEGVVPVAEQIELPFTIEQGLLAIADGRLSTPNGAGQLRLELPLDDRAGRVATAAWDIPAIDWAPLATLLTGLEDPEGLIVASRGEATVDLDRPTEAIASATLSEAVVTVRGRSTALEEAISLSVADGIITLPPSRFVSGEEVFELTGRGELARAWKPGDSVSEIVAGFEVDGTGTFDSGLLNPFLSGGRAEGPLGVDLRVAGSVSDFSGDVRMTGPEASILYRAPYLTRISELDLRIAMASGRVTIEEGTARINNGPLRFSGTLLKGGRSDQETGLGTDLGVSFEQALFRLDYGLLATVDGDLRYQAGPNDTALVSGDVTVERGSLTRDVQLDFDLLTELLAPIDLSTTADDPLALIALDLSVATREGVRVKNNLGDLLVRWEPMEVSGSLARPILEGEVEVDPGGLLYAYGQTVRLDRATIEYPGEEGAEPRFDFEATTSLEDPTIGRLAGDDPFRTTTPADESADPASAQVTADLARYYGEQFAGRVSESVGVKVSLRPLLIFGEADPGARLTVSRDLSTNLAIAASVDLRQAEGQTYLLEVHELRGLPRLVAQAFTDDASAYGGALLQRQGFGGAKERSDLELPRISRLVVELPAGVSRRGIKRALALEQGDRFDPRQRFVAEVELVDYLMEKGYPDARVFVSPVIEGRRGQKVRLELDIQPGPHVSFRFEGEEISKPLRRLIRSLYRPDFFEPESIEEMRVETVRSLRSYGFLDPRVEVSVEPVVPSVLQGDRTVIVRMAGGVKMSPETPVFLGLPAADAEVLDAVFANAVQRVELAIGLPSADRRLERALADLGYPQATIVNRYQSLDKRVLTVEIEPGDRQQIASLEIGGVNEEDLPGVTMAELWPLLAVAEGDPLRRNRLSRSVIALERELGSRGYLDARVRTVVGSAENEDQWAKAVTFLVEPGAQSRLSEVEFTGLRSTRERWARKVTSLESGAPLAHDDLSRARTKLWRTGLFSGVSAETVDVEPGYKRVVFDLAERDRYRLTYGVRWDSEDGLGAVVDATDDNFRGRAWTLGLRALYSNDEKSLRWLTRVPRAFGGPGSLEVFAAVRNLVNPGVDLIFGSVDVPTDRLEGTLQYSHPLSDRSTARTYLRYTDEEQTFPFFSVRIRNPQLGLQYVYDSRGPEPLTERGVFASVDLSGSQQFLGGDLRYVRMFSQFNLYRPAGRVLGRKLSWSQSVRLGLTETFDQMLISSRDVRFFAGGEYSVRGYPTESLGPQDFSGPTGGAALFVINQELRWRVLTDYVVVLFADAGNVWETKSELSWDLLSSAGLGLRALTPVGLLRLDIARPLDGRLGIDPDYKVYFGIGTTF